MIGHMVRSEVAAVVSDVLVGAAAGATSGPVADVLAAASQFALTNAELSRAMAVAACSNFVSDTAAVVLIINDIRLRQGAFETLDLRERPGDVRDRHYYASLHDEATSATTGPVL